MNFVQFFVKFFTFLLKFSQAAQQQMKKFTPSENSHMAKIGVPSQKLQ